MEACQIRPAKYLEYFDKRKLELFKNAPIDSDQTVATVWNIGVEALRKEQPKAELLLNLSAFFAPEPIRFALLQEARDALIADEGLKFSEELTTLLDPADDFDLVEACAGLHRYALATVDETSLNLHRLVALVTREKLTKVPNDYKRYAEYVAYSIAKLYPTGNFDYREWERCEELLRHAEAAARYADAANVALEAVWYLYNQSGIYLQGRALYPVARQNFERAIAIGERDLGTEHPAVATQYNNLGLVLQNIGDYPVAKSYYERATATREKVYGSEHSAKYGAIAGRARKLNG
jgi:tetratricopeptide (TPR) repeat protein